MALTKELLGDYFHNLNTREWTAEDISTLQESKGALIEALRGEDFEYRGELLSIERDIGFAGMPFEPIPKGDYYPEALDAIGDTIWQVGIWYSRIDDGVIAAAKEGQIITDTTTERFGKDFAQGGLPAALTLEFFYRCGFQGWSGHYPNEVGEDNLAALLDFTRERGMRMNVAGNVFAFPMFTRGGPTNNVPEVRELSLLLNARATEIAGMTGGVHTDWKGRDGQNGYMVDDHGDKFERMADAYTLYLLSTRGKVPINIETKHWEPVERNVVPNVWSALLMARVVEDKVLNVLTKAYGNEQGTKIFESDYKGKMRFNNEDRHQTNGGDYTTSADATSLALKYGRLGLTHPNDGRTGDTDTPYGSRNKWDALENQYHQVRYGWKGPIEPDIWAIDDDRIRATLATVNRVLRFRSEAMELLEGPWAKKYEQAKKDGRESTMVEFFDAFDYRKIRREYKTIPYSLADSFMQEMRAEYGGKMPGVKALPTEK